MSERQLIDSQGRFEGELDLRSTTAPQTSNEYVVISVVGCQSGGKSTLLNTAFGTSFPVLNAPKVGRRRTTLGVWGVVVPPNPGVPALIVFDIEGTDSRERGEGAVSFESRTSLFALAVSDVVLVNMWAHDIGRHSAANYDLFETVFSRTAAVPREGRVRLLVVVRDCEQDAPVAEIRRVLVGDLRNIWASLKCPPAQFDVLFDLRIVPLPHKVYAPEEFSRGVKELGRTIAAEDWQKKKQRQSVPLSGFNTFVKEIWFTICSVTGGDGAAAEFSLDLPKHVALTAHYKCGEVVSTIFDGQIGVRLGELHAEIETEWRKPVPEFGARMDAITRDAFEEYDKGASLYQESGSAGDSVSQRRIELGRTLAMRLKSLRERYLWVCKDFCMNGFEDEFRPMLGGTNGFERNAKRLANSYIARYRSLLDGARLPTDVVDYIESTEECNEDGSSVKSNGGVEQNSRVETVDFDVDLGLENESDDGDVDEYSCEKFKRDVLRMVEERRRLGDLMLPGGANFAIAAPKQDPWWKGLLIRTAIVLINYLQASHGQRAALKLQRKHEKDFPPGPTF